MYSLFMLPISFLLTSLLLPTPSRPISSLRKPVDVKRSHGAARIDNSFDYVIVGGGTAGLTVATRLAENPSLKVAVVEAGGFYEDIRNVSVVPGYDSANVGTDPGDTNPMIDWGFVTVPQKGANNRRMHYASGRTLGGSSARNYMYYHRQTSGSSQKWADEVEDSSYAFEKLLPFYEKSVHFNPPKPQYTNTTNDQDDSVFLEDGGPLQVSFGGYVDPFGTWALPALQKLGQKAIKGFASGVLIGSGYVAMTIDPSKMARSSSESSFLGSLKNNTFLTVYKNTLAERVIFNGTKAVGVTVSSNGSSGYSGTRYTLRARKEVIVSAGAFKSPQLLMVSGIGPRTTLERFNITVLQDLPGVGQNLWDQPYFGTSFRVNVPTASTVINDPTAAAAAIRAYIENQTGPLTMGGAGVIGFEKLPAAMRDTLSADTQKALSDTFPSDWPVLEWLPISAFIGNQTNYQTADPHDGYNYASMSTSLVAPLSRGSVSISSGSAADPPIIDPNWLTHSADMEIAIAAFKRQRTLWDFMSNLTIGEEVFPGPSVQSDEEILAHISQSLAPIWHAAATCKMGKATDNLAVVDPSMRVYGLQGLRVVDASSFPFLPPGHPQATVYALAEKIASGMLQQTA